VRLIERRAQSPVAEHLRVSAAIDRTGPPSRALGALQSIRHWNREQALRPGACRAAEQALEVVRIEARPRGVMHQHPVIGPGPPVERRERKAHRLAALRTAADRGEGARARGVQARGHLRPTRIVPRQRHDNMPTARIGEKWRERPFDHGASLERRVFASVHPCRSGYLSPAAA